MGFYPSKCSGDFPVFAFLLWISSITILGSLVFALPLFPAFFTDMMAACESVRIAKFGSSLPPLQRTTKVLLSITNLISSIAGRRIFGWLDLFPDCEGLDKSN